MYRLFVILLIVSYIVASCIDRVQLPIRGEDRRLVVEGQVTNEAPPSVRLTYTGKYVDATGQITADQYVNGAQVSLSDDRGRSTRFADRGLGIYQSADTTFRGQVGRAYSLTIVLSDGKRYVSKAETMPSVPVIDSISVHLRETDNLAKPYVVSYSANTRDPGGEKNYYRWTGYGITNRLATGVPCCTGCPICFDRCWVTVPSEGVNIFSDDAINGNPIRNRLVLEVPVYALAPQLIEIVQYGITQSNYQFWKLYQQQNARTGSIFDPLPAPVAGNVVNTSDPTDVARGYFALTSVTRKRLRQYNYKAPFYGALTSYLSGQFIPKGDCRNTYGPVPVTEPDGW